jgi:hypothetical protein
MYYTICQCGRRWCVVNVNISISRPSQLVALQLQLVADRACQRSPQGANPRLKPLPRVETAATCRRNGCRASSIRLHLLRQLELNDGLITIDDCSCYMIDGLHYPAPLRLQIIHAPQAHVLSLANRLDTDRIGSLYLSFNQNECAEVWALCVRTRSTFCIFIASMIATSCPSTTSSPTATLTETIALQNKTHNGSSF